MNYFKKTLLQILLLLLIPVAAVAQDNKTVTLTVSAQGQTISEAKQNALRDAIEQAFGTFVSSNTEILNDELIKDEIVSVSNGNIQDYEVISEVQLPNGFYATTLKATVSVTKLTSFVESKGVKAELKGSLFAYNINQQILNEKNEIKAIEDACQVIKNIADVAFDFKIKVMDPISLDSSNSRWRVPMTVSVFKNKNFDAIPDLLHSTLKGISLSLEQAESYIDLEKEVYPISIAVNEDDYSYIILRKEESISMLLDTFYDFRKSLENFKIINGIDELSFYNDNLILQHIYDLGFRFFLRESSHYSGEFGYVPPGVFFKDESSWESLGSTKKELGYIYDSNYHPIEYYFFGEYSTYLSGYPSRKKNSHMVNYHKRLHLKAFSKVFDHSFLKKLRKDKIILKYKTGYSRHRPGVVISFINLNSNKGEIVRFNVDDKISLKELKKVKKYEVIPINN